MLTTSRDKELKLIGWLCHGAGLASLVLAALATHRLVLKPHAQRERLASARTNMIQQSLQEAAKIHAEHTRLSRSLDEIRRRAETIRERIPDQPREAEFLRQLSQIAKEQGVIVKNYRRVGTVNSHNHSELTMHVQIEADYHGICGLLDGLAKLPRITTIEKMEIQSDPQDRIYPVDLTMILFYGVQTAESTSRRGIHEAT